MVSLQTTGRAADARTKSWWPTRKWFAATVLAAVAVATLWVTKGAFDRDVAIALIGAIGQAAVSYILPNQDSPGGVPVRT